MDGVGLIIGVGVMIFSLAFIFIIILLIPNKVTKEKLIKVIGEENIEKIKQAKDDEEIKAIIRALPKKRRSKLKTLMESQDIRDVLKALHEHILKERSESL